MSIHLLSKASGNPNLDLVFDPYVEGTKPPSTGLLDDSGSDIVNRYAPIVYGSQAAATGLLTEQAGHADINTLFAAYGTARYPLPINGNTYSHAYIIPLGNTGFSTIGFRIVGGTTWHVYWADPTSSETVLASGNVPISATTIKYTWGTFSIPVGDSDSGGGTTNDATTATSISSNPGATYQTATFGSSSGSRGRSYPFQIDFYNASLVDISTTNITLIAETDGSV